MNAESVQRGKPGERAANQRERILSAAQTCFVKHGFHAAGMAAIAETAEMSPGLIYRYFENKSAIILAIIERQLEENRSKVCSLKSPADFVAAILAAFECWKKADPQEMNAALFLEMTAEATRDQHIADALHASDVAMRTRFAGWMSQPTAEGGLGLPPELARTRALSLQCFIEGLAIRAIREPELSSDELKPMIEQFITGLAAHCMAR